MRIKKHRTDVNIDDDKFPNNDWEFITQRGFKPTNLLRSKIKELREKEKTGIDYEKQASILSSRLSKIAEVLNKELGEEQAREIFKKVFG